MPPLRSMPITKPLKTERTHEENQERAYIAASRRSDRSLEARVESARRASEIHKKRTGRSLRVTEQDVVNEEMYEEEDDDLPMQYRRLTAHLQTTNADFDRRLAAYLTNHVAMRTALGAAVSNNYAHSNYANAPQFANQMPQFMQQTFPNPMLPPQMTNRSPQLTRQPSHSMQTQQSHRPAPHSRSASIATPQELHGQTLPSPQSPVEVFKSEDRRMSLPVQGMTTAQTQAQQSPQSMSRPTSSDNLANLKHEAARQGLLTRQTSPKHDRPLQSPSLQQPSSFPSPLTDMSGNGMDRPPFSMALPMESQQLLGPVLDGNNSFHAMLLGKQEYMPQQSFYNYNPNGTSKKGFSPGEGMNQTLAPSMLDPMAGYFGNYNGSMSAIDSTINPTTGYLSFDNTNYNDMFKPSVSGLTTPGEHDWANFINSNAWEESSQPTNA